MSNDPSQQTAICAVIYADVAGSSQLSNEDEKATLNKMIREIVSRANNELSVIFSKTMGDGFLLCGSDPYEVAEFALSTRDIFRNANWGRLGLPISLALRTGMELGTVRLVSDKNGDIDVSGNTLERAARIEPIAPPNSIWITDHLANQLQREGATNIAITGVGEHSLSKNAGTISLYELRWSSENPEQYDAIQTDETAKAIGQIPRVRREFSDLQRDKFLVSAFREIRDYFARSLDALENSEMGLVKSRLEEMTSSKFIAEVHVNGELRSRCKIWMGGSKLLGGRNREISYASGDIDVDDDNSYNESMHINDDGYTLYLEAIGMFIWEDDEPQLTPEDAASHLWKNFSRSLE